MTTVTRQQWDSMRASLNARCIVWSGPLDGQGYGVISPTNRPQIRAHRWAWQTFSGSPVPPGMHVHHQCENTACVNPLHLELMSKMQHHRHHGKKHRLTTACPHGHEFNEQNFRPKKNGQTWGRRCLVCHREHEAVRKIAKRETRERAC